ncbi:MAG: cobalamin-dependent protein [Magnetococcales bacterium]|nr:cobalamin-dependent protein [Magnetococcales bacterium]
MADILPAFRDALESYDVLRAEALFLQAMPLGEPLAMVEALVVPTLQQIGDEWYHGRLALSQIYLSGKLCEQLVNTILLPLSEQPDNTPPRQAIAVLNDYHLLGKRIVSSMLRASGIALRDYGRVTVDELVEQVVADGVDILLISTLMLPSALQIREVRTALEARNVRVRIAVGGAPFLFDPDLWQEVGADAMGCTAADAIRITQQWIREGA